MSSTIGDEFVGFFKGLWKPLKGVITPTSKQKDSPESSGPPASAATAPSPAPVAPAAGQIKKPAQEGPPPAEPATEPVVRNWDPPAMGNDCCKPPNQFRAEDYDLEPRQVSRTDDSQRGRRLSRGVRVSDLYDFGPTLGTGGFSVVKMVTERSTGRSFACKIMALPPPGGHTGNDVTREDIFKEINILLELNHPNIIYLREYFEEANRAYLITEHLAGGELLDAVLAAGHYSEADARQAFRQLLQGVQYLHSKGYTHRDLKLENLLLSRPGDLSALKIADFGLAKDHVDAPLSTVCGTPQYVAPEVILRGRARTGSRGAPYGMQCDLWSAGVILFILLGGYPPFYDESEPRLFNKIRAARFAFDDPVWDKISDDAKDLVCNLLVVDPEARLTADQALAHAWLQQPPPGPAAPKMQLLATMSRMRASMKQRSWRPGQALEEDGPRDSLASATEDPAQQRENSLARQIIEEERESARANA